MKPKISQSICLIIVVMTILITGCTTGSGGVVYKKGTQGLVIEFSKSNPTSVYENESFANALFIKNMGAYTVPDTNPGSLRITYDTYRLAVKPNTATEVTDIFLEGKSRYYPTGAEAPVEFYFNSNSLTNLREGAKTTINYNLCYPYITEFTTMTCIDTKTAVKADSAAACVSEVYNGAGGQGAPIVVTKIEPQIMLQQEYIQPRFKIYIENLGGGYVMNRYSCDLSTINSLFGTGYNDFSGRVNVFAELSGEPLDCGPDKSGTLRLVDSDSAITCYLSQSQNTSKYSARIKNYLTSLTIRIEYTYVALGKQEIEIKRNDLLARDVNQGLCDSYQVEFNGKCIDKCNYCANNSMDPLCQEGKPYAGFEFREGFECKCNLAQCNLKEPKGSCIKGYCAGSMYCCSALNCDQYQVEYNGQCIDKCDYCTNINSSDTRICPKGFGNFVNFQCTNLSINKLKCDDLVLNKACINGFCGGANTIDYYCANTNRAYCPPTSNPRLTEPDPYGSCLTLCDYCAQGANSYSKNDARCKYIDKAQTRYITSGFSCSCVQNNLGINTDNFIPSDAYCGAGSGLYCCDMVRGGTT